MSVVLPRKRLACRICTRRKVKCDKQVPCDNCVRRGTPAECGRAEPGELNVQSNSDMLAPGHADDDAVCNALRRRVAELEAALQQQNGESGPALLRSLTSTPTPEQQTIGRDGAQLRRSASPSQDSDLEDAVTVLEFLAWGRMKDPEKGMLSPEALRVSEYDDGIGTSPAGEDLDGALSPDTNLVLWLQLLLPSRRQVYQLVDYHNNCMLWFHGSYFAPTFSKQLDSFYTDHNGEFDSAGLNLQWVALLFSIMAGTITSAPAHEARGWGFDEHEARLLSQKWYKAVIRSLNAANFTAHHSLHAVQAIAALTNTAHMLGHSNTQSVMLASAVRIAQSLGLHRLDEDARGGAVELETGRRVWQELCTQDWFSTAFSESYSINPLHSLSLAPKNCDENLHELPEAEPTVTSFCRFLAQIAAIMPALQDVMALSNTLYTKHEAVLVHDKKMRSLATGRPPFLANTAFDENWPCYIPWARRAIAMSSAHKIIMIHRKFLGLSFANPVFAFTRRTCLAAANTILKEYLASSKDESSPMLWTHQAFSVAACIVICFDMLHSSAAAPSAQDAAAHSLVDQTIQHLQLCRQKSMIAARGVKVLNALQKQVASRAESRKRPLLENESTTRDDGTTPRKRRRRGFNVAEFARSFCDVGVGAGAGVGTAVGVGVDNNRTSPSVGTSRKTQKDRQTTTSDSAESDVVRPQLVVESPLVIGVDEPFTLPADADRIWDMSLGHGDGSRTFDSLLSFANQGFGFQF